MEMFDLILLLIIAILGGVVSLIGFIVLVGRKLTQPKEELRQRMDRLEQEVRKLQNKN